MRHTNRNQNLVVIALALSLSGSVLAQNLTAPLSPQDPRAQLDPALKQYKPIPTPKYAQATLRAGTTVQLQSVDLETGETKQNGATTFASRGFQLGGRPFKGMATQLDKEPNPLGNLQGPLYVIGADSRVKINTTASYPWSTQCKLYIRFPDNSNWVGSGTIIQSRFVQTAGHCVYDSAHGGWASSIQVVPGMNGSYAPFGSAFAARLASNTGWTSSKSSDHDHAIIKLDRYIGNSTGWLGYGSFSDSTINASGLNLSAYDADRDGGNSQLYRSGPATSLSSKQMEYEMDTSGGSSGGGVYIFYNGGRYCMGVNCYEKWWWFFGTHYVNGGTRLDNQKVGWINNWLNGGL